MYVLFSFLFWQFAALANGVNPESRHDGSAWWSSDTSRQVVAGAAAAHRHSVAGSAAAAHPEVAAATTITMRSAGAVTTATAVRCSVVWGRDQAKASVVAGASAGGAAAGDASRTGYPLHGMQDYTSDACPILKKVNSENMSDVRCQHLRM